MAEAAARPSVEATVAELEEGFALFDDWEDRYRYLMELGRELAPLPAEAMVDANRVSGCQSRVWLTTRLEDEAAAPGCCQRRRLRPGHPGADAARAG